MAARRKAKPFAEDLDAIRATASRLLVLVSDPIAMEWTDWELDFLESMAGRATEEPLSASQVEKLQQLVRLSTLHGTIDGLSVALLIASAALQADYVEDDEDRAFIRQLRQQGSKELRRRPAGRLVRICRELGVIEPHHGLE